MAREINSDLIFLDDLSDYDIQNNPSDRIMHILCLEGSLSFVFHNVHYNIARGDYIILNNLALASGFSQSDDCRCIIMSFSESFFMSMALGSNYGFIGRFALLQNPVMKLSENELEKCSSDLLRLRERLSGGNHLFYAEMIGHLLMAHILDLYDIHARMNTFRKVPERAALILRKFIGLLYEGDYICHRNLEYYASKLCVTPHYLSEISKSVSGQPATYWIDRFTILEVIRLLRKKNMSLTEISETLNFSSLSYFSRYVQKHIGVSPSAYRSDFLTGRTRK